MSVTAVVVAEDDGMPEGPAPGSGSFLDPLVARLHARVRRRSRGRSGAARPRCSRSFAGARVQAFVPLLVEKRLRETFRGRSGLAAIPGGA